MLALAAVLAACGSDGPSEPGIPFTDLAGSYTLTTLAFDPQGVLPEVDLLARIAAENRPSLSLTAGGLVQITYRDPVTELTRVVNGTYTTTATLVRIDFGANPEYRTFLLSRRMDFEHSAATNRLTFDGSAPDGVSRATLLDLVPEWQNEQLLDPTPGNLRVVFART